MGFDTAFTALASSMLSYGAGFLGDFVPVWAPFVAIGVAMFALRGVKNFIGR